MPGRRGKQLLGLAAGVLAIVGGAYLLLGQTRVDVGVGGGGDGAPREVACGNAFAGGRRAEVPTVSTATTATTAAGDATGTTAPPTTAPPTTAAPTTTAETVPADGADGPEEVAIQAAEDAAIEDCDSAKRPRTIAGGALLAVGLGAVVVLTQLLDTAGFADD